MPTAHGGLGHNPGTVVVNSIFDGQDMAFGGTAATSITYICTVDGRGAGRESRVLDATPTYSFPGNPNPGFINAPLGNFDLVSILRGDQLGRLTLKGWATGVAGQGIPLMDVRINALLCADLGAYEAAPGVTTIRW